jgi:hypothetical protein
MTEIKYSDWKRTVTVRVQADPQLSAWHVRDFVNKMDAAGIDDNKLIDASRGVLFVRQEHTMSWEPDPEPEVDVETPQIPVPEEPTAEPMMTDRSQKVMALAREEAQRLGHNYIGTEHILLGLLAEGEGIGAGVLESLGVNLEKVRKVVEFILGRGATASNDG